MEDRGSLVRRMAGGANDHRLLVLGRSLGDAERGGMKTEIDHHVRAADHRVEIIAEIDLADDFQHGILSSEADDGLPHATLGTGDDEFDLVHSLADLVKLPSCKTRLQPLS